MAKAKEAEPRLFNLIAKVTMGRLDSFVEAQHLSNTIWAFATSKIAHKPLFEAAADIAIERKEEFSPQQVSNLIWAYSFIPVGTVNHVLCKHFEPVIFKLVDDCNTQFFANIAWAYAVANFDSHLLFDKSSPFIQKIILRYREFNLEALCQLHQFILWRKELKAEMPFPLHFERLCYKSYVSRGPSPSAFQDNVINELKSMGLEPQEEFMTSTGYSLDALVKVNDEQVGIEVDGPFHFAGQRLPLGKMTLKHRQVSNLAGVRLVSIPYWEWGGCVDKKEYLKTKLDLVGESPAEDFTWVL
jgi:hypothetical protein